MSIIIKCNCLNIDYASFNEKKFKLTARYLHKLTLLRNASKLSNNVIHLIALTLLIYFVPQILYTHDVTTFSKYFVWFQNIYQYYSLTLTDFSGWWWGLQPWNMFSSLKHYVFFVIFVFNLLTCRSFGSLKIVLASIFKWIGFFSHFISKM